MDAFGWSTQLPGPPAPSDDALLAAFLGSSSFAELHCDGGAGHGTVTSSDAYGGALGLPPPCQSDLSLLRCQNGVTLPGRGDASSDVFLDPVGLLPAIDGAHDGFAFPNVPAQADGSNAAFSGYSTTTGGGGGGGGNISSGESNTYGGGDTEVASSPCAVSRPMLPQPRAAPTKSNKLPDKYPAAKATAATTAARTSTTSITFGRSGGGGRHGYEPDTEAIAQVKEMIYRAAAMRPVSLGRGPGEASTPAEPSSSKPRRRKNVRISSDPQTVAARLRRERVSERLRALQRLVPGGSKMDTASMLDEAASYLRFLKSQVAALETLGGGNGGARGVDDDVRYASPLQRYAGRNFGLSSRGGGGGAGGATVLSFGRDGGVAGVMQVAACNSSVRTTCRGKRRREIHKF